MKYVSKYFGTIVTIILLATSTCFNQSAFAQPAPGQAGTYVGTAKGSYFDYTGKKITNTTPVTMVVSNDSSVLISFNGFDNHTCPYANFTPVSIGFYAGLTSGYSVTGIFTVKNGTAKGPYHFVSPYGATFGKMTLKKAPTM